MYRLPDDRLRPEADCQSREMGIVQLQRPVSRARFADGATGKISPMTARTITVGLLEDDVDQAVLLQHWLEEEGYSVRRFASAAAFRARKGVVLVDLLLLDWMLPDGTGIEVVKAIRGSTNPQLPVVFLTARSNDEDIVQGLREGGDDYIVKPPKRAELLARVATICRRLGLSDDAPVVVELIPYLIDFRARKVSMNGVDVEMTRREFDLAGFLFRRSERVVGRDTLLHAVWNLGANVTTRTVDTHISRLRKKLELNGEHGWRLAAIHQYGYRLERSDG